MERWGTHAQCEVCWILSESVFDEEGQLISIRSPSRLVDPPAEQCCFCGNITIGGIYRRFDGNQLQHCPGHPG